MIKTKGMDFGNSFRHASKQKGLQK